MPNYCPECKTPLLPSETKCVCGWRDSKKAEKGMKCTCGQMARIYYMGWLCWDCHHQKIKGTDKEDWRDRMSREKMEELGLNQCGNEPDWSAAKRARALLKTMGGFSGMMKSKVKKH